jgi:hypothetical protein
MKIGVTKEQIELEERAMKNILTDKQRKLEKVN